MHDIFWTLANLTIIDEIPSLIAKHPFWLDRVLKLDLGYLGGTSAVTELCFAVVGVLLPICSEEFAYGL